MILIGIGHLIHIPTFNNFCTSALQVQTNMYVQAVFCCLLFWMACIGILTASLTGVYLLAVKAVEIKVALISQKFAGF